MDKNQFAATVTTPRRFTPQDRGWLHAMLAKYPHSSIVSILTLLADHAHNFDTPQQRRATALAMCDNSRLDAMLAAATNKIEEPQVDIFNEINTYQEVSFKTAPKSVILSNFLQSSPTSEVEKALASTTHRESDDKKSIRIDDSLATETLALILEKQGKFERAVEVYRKLLAANPEKSSTFAARIAKLQEIINSK